MIVMVLEDHIKIRDPLIEGDILTEGGRTPDQGGYPVEDP